MKSVKNDDFGNDYACLRARYDQHDVYLIP